MIGCGVNFKENTAFFTKNGVKIGVFHGSRGIYQAWTNVRPGTAFHDVTRGKLYPAVSIKKPGESIRVNFGKTPFIYNIDDLMRVGLCDPLHSIMHN